MLQYANFLLLDAAIMRNSITEARARNAAHMSLFEGRPEAGLDGVAPFLFAFALRSDFANWCLPEGWGRSWGIFIKSTRPMSDLLAHLQQRLRAKSEDGQQFIFRFYDPRVLRTFLRTCDASQLREFFGQGQIDHCIVEDADSAFALRFRHENGILKTERFPVAAIMADLPQPLELPEQPVSGKTNPGLLAALRAKYPDSEPVQVDGPYIELPPAKKQPHSNAEGIAKSIRTEPDHPGNTARATWKLFD